MLIIPAIDILNGKAVRLQKGDFNKVTEYANSPVEQAILYESHGFEYVHMVDLEGSKTGRINIAPVISEIKQRSKIKIEFGGGIRSLENVKELIELGVDKIVIGSLSVKNKNEFEKIISNFGADKLVIAADVLDMKIAVKGWTEDSGIHLFDHINYCSSLGCKHYLCTDIKKDGMMKGPSVDLYKQVQDNFPAVNLIASGGVSSMPDIEALSKMNIYAAIVGKAIYEKQITLEELAEFGK